jgi:alkylhydroperoxidase/carboxymuconolactone decarboxylase family protein YurZ
MPAASAIAIIARGSMNETALASPPREFLLRLAAGDEATLRAVLRPTLETPDSGVTAAADGLDRRTRLLVGLAALLALDAPTDSLRWAVELASAAGADEDAMAAVLLATGSAAGSAQLVASAARLAVALDYETDGPGEPLLGY